MISEHHRKHFKMYEEIETLGTSTNRCNTGGPYL